MHYHLEPRDRRRQRGGIGPGIAVRPPDIWVTLGNIHLDLHDFMFLVLLLHPAVWVLLFQVALRLHPLLEMDLPFQLHAHHPPVAMISGTDFSQGRCRCDCAP